MIVDCVADLHGYLPKLDGGDLLIIAGDLTARDESKQYIEFYRWLEKQAYRKKIIVPGNHDNYFQKCNTFSSAPFSEELATYLCDSGTEFEGFKIWGSPWTKTFPGMNPHCKAFTFDSEKDLLEKWKMIPTDTDILITHSPAYGILDRITSGKHVGSKSLQMELFTRLKPKLFVCGHIHEAYGIEPKGGFIENAVNVSYVNERYEPVNPPLRFILEEKQEFQLGENMMG